MCLKEAYNILKNAIMEIRFIILVEGDILLWNKFSIGYPLFLKTILIVLKFSLFRFNTESTNQVLFSLIVEKVTSHVFNKRLNGHLLFSQGYIIDSLFLT